MTNLRTLALMGPALAGVSAAASAQDPIAYDTGEYVVAQPAPEQGVIFQPKPVVQPIQAIDPDDEIDGAPEAMEAQSAMSEPEMAPTVTAAPVSPEPRILYAYPAVYAQGPYPGSASRVIYRHGNQPVAAPYTYVYEGSAPPVPPGGRIVTFDREAWIAECTRRITPVEYYEEDGNGEVAGAVVGAVVGGLAGRAVAGRGNRTLGTLAGAGLGAVAGAAIGDSVDDRSVPAYSEDRSGECAAYLDGYMASARTGGLHGQYSPSGEYMLVPVTVMVPQRAVYSQGYEDER